MKAVYITEHGTTDVLTYGELPEPDIGPTDVKIRVKACALNRLDLYTREGSRGMRVRFNGPHILGGDASGDVAEVGSDVTNVKVGDRVVVNPCLSCDQFLYSIETGADVPPHPRMLGSAVNGGYAEYVSVPVSNVVKLPDSLSYEQAASLPTVFLPSWTILVRKGNLKPWETALIPSASSGVGTAAIQIAKNVVGARVIATTSSDEKAQKARELGADEVINYREEDLAARIKEITNGKGVNVVVDHVGADFWPAAMSSLATGGRYGICGVTSGYKSELQMGLLFLKYQTVFGVFMSCTDDLAKIVELAGDRTIKGIIHQTFPLEQAAEAHKTMESLGFFGKLVLTVP
jgi:NADPH:quinone reductase-like Zn-dependent oxidoreductase